MNGTLSRIAGAAVMMAVLGPVWLPAQSPGDEGLGSTNLDKLQTFWQAVERSDGPVTVLAFGDSMSASWQSVQYELFDRLQNKLGVSGDTLQVYRNRTLWQYGGGAAAANHNPNWWTLHGSLPPGGFIFWTNLNHTTGSLLCDHVGVYWVAHPGGGSFALRVSTNGQAWSDPLLALDGFADSPVGRHTNLALARGFHRLRVDGLTGTNSILGPEYLDHATNGVNVAFMARDGANLDQIFSLPTNVLYPVLSAINPQLVVHHMKELPDLGELGLSNQLFALEAMWRACVTNGDVVYLGTPYDYRDATQEGTPRENRLLRQAAVRDQRAFLDCMTPCVSYQAMVTNGFISDGIHPNRAGNAFLTDVIWPQLGFFALRTDRQLALTTAREALRVEWSSATNLVYELQSSSNLSDWEPLQIVAGNGQRQAWTNPTAGPRNLFFRLRLTPD